MGRESDATGTDDSEQSDSDANISRRTLITLGLLGITGGFAVFQVTPELMRETPTGVPQERQYPDPASLHRFRYAAPGTVQDHIDQAAEMPQSRVFLYPEITYELTSTWQIRSGVTLDYNGATVEVKRDVDVHDVHPGGCVERPVVDLRSVRGGFSSSVFKFDSERHGFYGDSASWYVRGGITRGTSGEGTLYEFAQGGENAIYYVHADHSVWGIGTVVEMHRGDAFGINGNRIYGLWTDFDVGIHMYTRRRPEREVDNVSGNHFDVIAQPNGSRILWDQEVGRFNVLRGRLWDFSAYEDVMWRIHGDDADSRIGNILYWFPVGGSEDLLLEQVGPRVFDDQLGDYRNRVIVPWLQGRPVGDYSD